MRCLICRKGPMDGTTLFRVNAKGQPGIWACAKHRPQTDAPKVPEVDAIVDLIEKANRP